MWCRCQRWSFTSTILIQQTFLIIMTKQKSKLTYFGKIVFEFDYKNYSKVKKCVFEGGWKTYKMSFR